MNVGTVVKPGHWCCGHWGGRFGENGDSAGVTPIGCYSWAHTDAALNDQLELEEQGFPGVVEPGHAAIRYTNPTTGGDVMATIRAEFHRLTAGTTTTALCEVGNRVIQCFEGSATVTIGDETFELNHGDVTVVPS